MRGIQERESFVWFCFFTKVNQRVLYKMAFELGFVK